MKKIRMLFFILIFCCLTGCATKSSYIPTEEEILKEVEKWVPEEYEHIRTEKTKTSTTCYFECKNRNLSFVAKGFVANNVPVIPMPQCMAGYVPQISCDYRAQVLDMYYSEIRALFEGTDMVKSESDAVGYKEIQVLLYNEKELEQFMDLVMQGDEILKKEQEYVDADVLAEKELIYYTVWIPSIQVYANGEKEYRDRRCLQFASSSTLDRDEVMAQIKQSIEETNEEVLSYEHIVLYGEERNMHSK